MMDTQRVHEIIDHIDPALIEGLDAPKKRRLSRPARIGLIAACLCAVLVGTALAAESLWGVFSKGIVQSDPNVRSYEFIAHGLTKFPHEEVGEDLKKKLAENLEQEERRRQPVSETDEGVGFTVRMESLTCASWAELEKGLGVPLADNARLEELCDSASSDTVFFAMPNGNQDGLLSCDFWANILLEDQIYVSGRFITDLSEEEDWKSAHSYSYGDTEVCMETGELKMADGGTAMLTVTDIPEYGYTFYEGQFVMGGIYYDVSITSQDGPSEKCETLLHDILSAFRA